MKLIYKILFPQFSKSDEASRTPKTDLSALQPDTARSTYDAADALKVKTGRNDDPGQPKHLALARIAPPDSPFPIPPRSDIDSSIYLNHEEAWRYLRMKNANALYKQVSRHQVPFIKHGKHLLYKRASLDAHLADLERGVEK